MNKTWITLIIVAVVTILAIVGYNFYRSISGDNLEFTKAVAGTPISPDLGTEQLEYLTVLQENVEVQSEDLD